MEINGRLSVMKKKQYRNATLQDVKPPGNQKQQFPLELIMEGEILYGNLDANQIPTLGFGRSPSRAKSKLRTSFTPCEEAMASCSSTTTMMKLNTRSIRSSNRFRSYLMKIYCFRTERWSAAFISRESFVIPKDTHEDGRRN